MRWTIVAIVVGSALLVLGFGFGVEPSSASANPPGNACRSVIPSSWLVSGTPDTPSTTSGRGGRWENNCRAAEERATWLSYGGIALGSLTLLVGWTAARERQGLAVLAPA